MYGVWFTFMVCGSGFTVQSLELRVYGSEFRVEGLGFGGQG